MTWRSPEEARIASGRLQNLLERVDNLLAAINGLPPDLRAEIDQKMVAKDLDESSAIRRSIVLAIEDARAAAGPSQ